MPRLTLFLGKGGVGKTTVSSAYAVLLAAEQKQAKVALVSTDPAHSLGDIFAREFADEFRSVRVAGGGKLAVSEGKLAVSQGNLAVSQIDAQLRLDEFLQQHRPELLDLLEQGTFFERADLEPLLETTLPGMAEMAALLRLDELLESGEYGEIVIDTAPLGHTLRLLEMPQSFLRFLDFLDLAARRDQVLARTFGGRGSGKLSGAFVAEWRAKSTRLLEQLAGKDSEIVMVSSPEQFSVRETRRALASLRALDPPLAVRRLVVNRALRGAAGKCARCAAVRRRTKQAMAQLQRELPGVELLIGRDDGDAVIGTADLLAFGAEVFRGTRRKAPATAKQTAMPQLLPVKWPRLRGAIGFSMGKGGVGKTTIAAATALASASHAPQNIAVCSTDPAPSLDDVFQADVGETLAPVLRRKNLFACELDGEEEFRRWAQPLQQRIERAFQAERGGLHVDLSFERELFSSLLDIVPPGIDELFAVLKIADMGSGGDAQLVIDMAPTGHALELLRTPQRMLGWCRLLLKSLAPHRQLPLAQEIAVEVATIAQRVRGLEKLLKDSGEVWMVLLPEALPDRESARLYQALVDLDLKPGMVFLNRVLLRATACPRCRRARAAQAQVLRRWQRRGGEFTLYVVPEFGPEVAGAARLQRFTAKLYRFQEE